jgi:hypothetical protein
MDYLLNYHRWAAEGLLLIMLINLAVPYILRSNIAKMIFWMRVGYFAFWAFWTMTAFDGLITWIFTHRKLPAAVWLMIVVSAILPLLDGYRAIKLKKLWRDGNDGVLFNITIVGIEIALTLITIIYGLYGK